MGVGIRVDGSQQGASQLFPNQCIWEYSTTMLTRRNLFRLVVAAPPAAFAAINLPPQTYPWKPPIPRPIKHGHDRPRSLFDRTRERVEWIADLAAVELEMAVRPSMAKFAKIGTSGLTLDQHYFTEFRLDEPHGSIFDDVAMREFLRSTATSMASKLAHQRWRMCAFWRPDRIGFAELPLPLAGTGVVGACARHGNVTARAIFSYEPRELRQLLSIDTLFGMA